MTGTTRKEYAIGVAPSSYSSYF